MKINGKFRSVQYTEPRPVEIPLSQWREYIADENYQIEERKRIAEEKEIEEKIRCILDGYDDEEVVSEACKRELLSYLDLSA